MIAVGGRRPRLAGGVEFCGPLAAALGGLAVQGHFSRAVLLSGEVIADGAPTRVIPTLYINPNLSEVTV